MPTLYAAESPVQSSRIVAAFDFDGTITTSDSLRDFVRYVEGPGQFAIGVVEILPWLLGMSFGVYDRGFVKARFLAATVAGMTESKLEEKARQYASQRLPMLVRPEMAARIQEHRQRGHQLVLVSASPSLYLKYWAASAGFDAVLATELEFRNGVLSGRLAGPNCWGPEKVQRLQQWFAFSRPHTLYAYGDSRGDREMLALADYGWLRGTVAMPSIETWQRKTTTI